MLNKFFTKRLFCSDNIINNTPRNVKSIFKKKTQEITKTEIFDILEYGYPESRYLRQKSDEMVLVNNMNKYKNFIESLKLTAANHNLYSLSSPQVKSCLMIFLMHKDLSEYKWINEDPVKKLNHRDYNVIINPRIVRASKINHYDYEECTSFKVLKAKAKRPLALQVAYFDENGKPHEKELFDFEARVFSHEFDHLKGIPFIHWKVSEGDILIKETEDPYENLQITIDYYRNRLRDVKMAQPTLFDYFDVNLINNDMETYFEDQMQIDYEFRNKKSLSFDDVMLIDIEKGIRKDLKLKLKRMTQKEASHIRNSNLDVNNHIKV